MRYALRIAVAVFVALTLAGCGDPDMVVGPPGPPGAPGVAGPPGMNVGPVPLVHEFALVTEPVEPIVDTDWFSLWDFVLPPTLVPVTVDISGVFAGTAQNGEMRIVVNGGPYNQYDWLWEAGAKEPRILPTTPHADASVRLRGEFDGGGSQLTFSVEFRAPDGMLIPAVGTRAEFVAY